jgi:hypothetical protein
MFTWICPKCKSEVPPSYNECPNCAALSAPPPLPADPQVVQQGPPAPPPRVIETTPPVREAEPPFRSRATPPWLVAVGSMAAIAALLAILYLWVLPSRRNAPASAAATDRPSVPGVALNAHPLAKHLEISGIRLTEDERRRAQIQFVVTNHSGADLPELKMQISLLTSGNKPAFDFPFTLPSLGPYESKDFSTLVKTELRVYELPDWQFLRAEFRINSPQ